MKYFVANWKAHKNIHEAKEWLEEFTRGYEPKDEVTVIIAPSFPFIQEVAESAKNLSNVHAAAQDISSFSEGSYTGEVTAKSLQGLAEYVIAGHSERGKYFGESHETIVQKIELARKYGIEAILCIRGTEDHIVSGVNIVAYEPLGAIGTGENVPVEEVLQFKKTLNHPEPIKFLYGGSVTDENVHQYLGSDEIDGLLVGGASLDPNQFLRLIYKA